MKLTCRARCILATRRAANVRFGFGFSLVSLHSIRRTRFVALSHLYQLIMRRAQSLRNYSRQSISPVVDDLGVLKEAGEETMEDVLRQQLSDKTKENEKVSSADR